CEWLSGTYRLNICWSSLAKRSDDTTSLPNGQKPNETRFALSLKKSTKVFPILQKQSLNNSRERIPGERRSTILLRVIFQRRNGRAASERQRLAKSWRSSRNLRLNRQSLPRCPTTSALQPETKGNGWKKALL